MQKHRVIYIIEKILSFFMLVAFIFLILGEILLPVENIATDSACIVWQADWERVLPDGSRMPASVPGECDAKRGELVVLETVLPQDQGNATFCIRSLQQELHIFVDGVLRAEYSTLETQPFGKTSTMNYVFFGVTGEDAGKRLRMELQSDSAYAGSASEILVGEKSEIWKFLLRKYALATLIAIFMVVLSLVVLGYSYISRLVYKKELEIEHLGKAILLASTWILMESRLRQFFLPNSTVAMNMGFMMIMLFPYPFLSYLNTIQKYRYEKVYGAVQICAIINCIVAVTLQVANVKDFFETMGVSHVIIICMLLLMAATILLDVRKGYIGEYKEVVFGFVGLMVAGFCEIGMVYVNNSAHNGIALCIGLVFLLFTAGMKTGKDVLRSEKEKQIAIAASESKANFLANMSHEIRTPINTVIGMNEMILRENKDDTIHEYAYNIKSASQMLLGLVNDILDISKIEAGKLQIVEGDYALASMLKDVALGIEVRAKQKNLEWKLEIDETMPSVLKGDEIRIKQILNNLLSNAVKYTEDGTVTLGAEGIRGADEFVLKLSVTDTGMGIRQEDMDTLFDSFRRLELKKNRYVEGTGLGLSITKRLIEQMNGKIEVNSEFGKGSCFTVFIPQQIVDETVMGTLEQAVYKKRNADRDMQSEQDGRVEAQVFCAPNARVLAVDDNKMNLKVIQALLKRSQVQLDMASGGEECLEMTKNKKYDLILMDHMMPEPDGVQTLHMMRNDKRNANHTTNVVVLTANAVGDVETEYRKKGFSDYLAKPIDTDKLEQILIKYLSARVKKG